jgi:hypothetical protein
MRLWKLVSWEGLFVEPAVQSSIQNVFQVRFVEVPLPQLTDLGAQT